MQDARTAAQQQGGTLVVGGGRRLADEAPDAWYVEPAVVRMPDQTDIVRQETFAPVLYVLPYRTLEEAIALNNDVPQGLSSSIFTSDHAEAERFLAALRIVDNATSFGGVRSTAERRARWGGDDVPEGFIRLSVGIEDAADLVADLTAALDHATG